MGRSLHRLRIAAMVILPCFGAVAEAQSGVTVLGRVLDPAGAPMPYAAVTVTALETGEAKAELTALDGSYGVAMARRAAGYMVSARMRGYATQGRQLAVGASDSMLVVDFRLVRDAQALPEVRIVSRRPPPVREQGRYLNKPGESPSTRNPSIGFGSALTGDVSGDMALALGGVPGISMTTDASGRSSFTLAGLAADQNRLTVNGADVVVPPPREGGVLRVSTTGYDPTIAMSGARAEWLIVGANYGVARRARLTLDMRPLQFATPAVNPPGDRSSAPVILSGTLAGPLSRVSRPFVPRFFTTSFDLSRRAGRVATLASADASALGTLGVGVEPLRRILSARETLGLGVTSLAALEQSTTSVVASTRLDFTDGSLGRVGTTPTGEADAGERQDAEPVFYLLLGGRRLSDDRSSVGPLSLASVGSQRSITGLTAQAFLSAYPKEFIVNETRFTVATERSSVEPSSALPAASVLTASTSTPRAAGFTAVQVAGSGRASAENRYASLQLANETQWTSVGRRHQWKLGFEALMDELSTRRGTGAGVYTFPSVDAFVANRPASFTRLLSPGSSRANGLHLAAALGDLFEPTRSWSWQYGVRVEGHAIRDPSARSSVVDSIFGIRTGSMPMTLAVSPMVGFTWLYGPRNAQGYPGTYHSVVGGIRDYRGSLPTRGAHAAGPGLGALELHCVGDDVPTPTWRSYATEPERIPERCADGGLTRPAFSAMSATSYEDGYVPGHSWRADLSWNSRPSTRLFSTLRGTVAFNARQPTTFDLNLARAPRFSLGDEGGRPVFASPTGIDSGTGHASITESRRNASYARVDELRSDLRSRHAAVTAALSYRPAFSRTSSRVALPFEASYTLVGGSAQSDGFTGSTAGDPALRAWQRHDASRHVLLAATAVHVPDWMQITAGLQLRSGRRYTPLVLGDVNGDGRLNDRAFAFDPRAPAAGAVGDEMSALLANAPAAARACLRTQLGRIVAPNSCVGPWTATLNGIVALDPARVGLQNRGTVQLRVTNVLAAIYQLIHGSNGRRAWGPAAYPDPVLLRVTGFDAAARSYRYAVNPAFGDARASRGLSPSSFRVSLDVSLDLGPNLERVEIVKRASAGREGGQPVRLDSTELDHRMRTGPRPLLDFVVQDSSRLGLTSLQVDSIGVLSEQLQATRDSVYGALAGFLASREGLILDRSTHRRWRGALGAVTWAQWRAGRAVRALLTDEQWRRLFDGMYPYDALIFAMDERELARTLQGWQRHAR